jgi:hypothetical protein
MREVILKMTAAGILGSGRVISAAAIQNLNIMETFKLWGLPFNVSEGLAITAAVSNGLTNASTRVKSIYDKLPPTLDFFSLEGLTKKQKAIVYTLMGIGIADAVYFTANIFNATAELRCNLFNETGCPDFIWDYPTGYLIFAGFSAISNKIAFIAFNLSIMKVNAVKFAKFTKNFSGNLAVESKGVLLGSAALMLATNLVTASRLYYSTSSMVNHLFGPALSQNTLVKLQVPIAIGGSLVVDLFTRIADGKNLLDSVSQGISIKEPMKRWFYDSQGIHKIMTYMIAPLLILDMVFSGFASYAGSAEFLGGISQMPHLSVIIISGFIAFCSSFLYFAFNINRGLDNLAGVNSVAVPQILPPPPLPPGAPQILPPPQNPPRVPRILAPENSTEATPLIRAGFFHRPDSPRESVVTINVSDRKEEKNSDSESDESKKFIRPGGANL